MNHSTCTTLLEAETCAVALAACPDADGRVIGLAIQVAIAALRSNHGVPFVTMLAHLDAHYSRCDGAQEHLINQGGH